VLDADDYLFPINATEQGMKYHPIEVNTSLPYQSLELGSLNTNFIVYTSLELDVESVYPLVGMLN